MKKIYLLLISILVFSGVAGCGYSARTVSPLLKGRKTIYVAPFNNRVDYESESRTSGIYVPMIETQITNETINRFLFDGHLRIAMEDQADLTLKGDLLGYHRNTLRYDRDDETQEYRIRIVVSLTLWDNAEKKAILSIPRFTGDATFFLSGARATPEAVAIDEAIQDLARRIVDRIVEDW